MNKNEEIVIPGKEGESDWNKKIENAVLADYDGKGGSARFWLCAKTKRIKYDDRGVEGEAVETSDRLKGATEKEPGKSFGRVVGGVKQVSCGVDLNLSQDIHAFRKHAHESMAEVNHKHGFLQGYSGIMLGRGEEEEAEEEEESTTMAGQGTGSTSSLPEDPRASFDLAAARNALLQSAADSLQTEQKQLEKVQERKQPESVFQASEQTCHVLATAPMPSTFAEASLRQSYGATLEYRTRVVASVLGITWKPATTTQEKEEEDATVAVEAEGAEPVVVVPAVSDTPAAPGKTAKKVGMQQTLTLQEVLQRQKDALRPPAGLFRREKSGYAAR
eukprot:1173861-Amphidinium_carterae.1